jgi:putative protein-disulfide isomerase
LSWRAFYPRLDYQRAYLVPVIIFGVASLGCGNSRPFAATAAPDSAGPRGKVIGHSRGVAVTSVAPAAMVTGALGGRRVEGPHLIYFADPMCSWCYGFSRVIDEIRAAFAGALPIRLVMGGLRPGAEEPMAEAAKAEIEGHWRQVQAATGLVFDATILRREGFVYDTDPAARAVVVLRRDDPELAVRFLGRVQSAFYSEGRDVTRGEVLAELVAEFGLDPKAFTEAWSSEAAQQETWRDYAISQHAGVTGFPTLVAGPNDEGVFGVVTRGYAPPAQVVGVLRDWIQRIAA